MQIKFLGAAQEVTGSCFLVDTGSRRVLVDCGLIQGDPKHEARNRSAFPFAARSVDAVVLSHAHLDHSGRLPLLVKAGFSGPIYTHAASRDLCRIMLRDAALLNERDTEWENRKRARKGHAPLEPLYTRADADAAMRRFRTVPYGADTEILPGVSLRLCDAGHILGSAIVQLRVATNSQRKTVVFSGDLGHAGAPILRDPQRVTGADLVVLESTYGDRNHRSWDATWAELAQVFNNTERIRGNILIPAFAVGRSQEILYIMKQHYREWRLDRWRVFLDSPMAIEATEVYSRHWVEHDQDAARLRRGGNPFALPNLHITRTPAQSMAINRINAGAIIIAGSGMCTGGRIRHHLKHNIWREQTQIVFVGFQAAGTLGRRLVDGARHIRLWGETMRVAARVHTIGGLSAHAGQAQLLGWYEGFRNRPPVALVHGEVGAMRSLGALLKKRYGAQVSLPTVRSSLDVV